MTADEIVTQSVLDRTTYFGKKISRYGFEELIGVDDSDRVLYTAVTGPTGQGKTNLLLWIALQDGSKTGVTFLNPEGSVIDRLICKLPDDRLDDVLYINPSHGSGPGDQPVEASDHQRNDPGRKESPTPDHCQQHDGSLSSTHRRMG